LTEPREQLATTFRRQALGAKTLGSALYDDLFNRMAADVEAGGPTWTFLEPHAHEPLNQVFPLRVAGGAHRLALEGEAPALARHLLSTGGDGDHDGAWRALLELLRDPPRTMSEYLKSPPQTNEVARSASMIGGFLVVAQQTRLPVRALEIGTSAGLNLRFDCFRYEQGAIGFGPSDSTVRFTDLWPNGMPPFDAPLTVADRRGCDRSPIDPTTDDGRMRLLSYVWPDQPERFERIAAAIDIAREVPALVERADAGAWLSKMLGEPVKGVVSTVFHSVVVQYFTDDERAELTNVMEDAGARATPDAPVAWLRLEPEGDMKFPRLRLSMWPGEQDVLLAHCSFHLGPVDWKV
jgi:hypothetical protein